jgi:hypothetical protein
MPGIYNYVPETKHVSRVHNFAGTLRLQFMLHVVLFTTLNVLYFYISSPSFYHHHHHHLHRLLLGTVLQYFRLKCYFNIEG